LFHHSNTLHKRYIPQSNTTIHYHRLYSTPSYHRSTLPNYPPKQHNGRSYLRRVQHGIAKSSSVPRTTTNTSSASGPIEIDWGSLRLSSLQWVSGALRHRYSPNINIRIITFPQHLHRPYSTSKCTLLWHAGLSRRAHGIARMICSSTPPTSQPCRSPDPQPNSPGKGNDLRHRITTLPANRLVTLLSSITPALFGHFGDASTMPYRHTITPPHFIACR
jgi:hypothetical protein